MINLSRLFAASVLSVLLLFFACKKDDPQAACEHGSFEMTFNGEHVTGGSFDNTLLKDTDGRRMDIRVTNADGTQLIITLTDLSTAGNENSVSTDEYIAYDNVTTGTENTFLFTIIQNGVSESYIAGNLDITSCDAKARQVSGTFSFSEGSTEVTDGSFTDLCYTIL